MCNTNKIMTGVRNGLPDVIPVVIPRSIYDRLERKAGKLGMTARSLIALIVHEGLECLPDYPSEQALKQIRQAAMEVLLSGE